MNKTLLLILTGTLAVSVEGCSYLSEFVEKRKEIENPPTISTSVQAEASGKNAKSPESKDKPVDSQQTEGVKRNQDVVGLIPSTDPDIRIRSSIRGRQDPFAVVSVKPTIEIKEDKKNNRSRGLPNSPNPRVRRPQEITSTPTIETVENLPNADLAENVLITGLVELGDRIQIILQAPEEASSRYVEVGQYISNGQVLVKRIESSFPTPVVVLEQAGIEVDKVVGQAKEETTEEEKNTFLPPPPPSISLSNPVSLLSEKVSQK